MRKQRKLIEEKIKKLMIIFLNFFKIIYVLQVQQFHTTFLMYFLKICFYFMCIKSRRLNLQYKQYVQYSKHIMFPYIRVKEMSVRWQNSTN